MRDPRSWIHGGAQGRAWCRRGDGHPGTPGELAPPTWEGLGDLLVPGILPANQGLLPSSAALGQHQAHHSPARLALGTRLPPVYRQPPPPQSESQPPVEWGRDDRWRRCHFNQSLQQWGKGRRDPRAGGGWDLALLPPPGALGPHSSPPAPLASPGHPGLGGTDPTTMSLGPPRLPWTRWVRLGSAGLGGPPRGAVSQGSVVRSVPRALSSQQGLHHWPGNARRWPE